MLRLIALLTVVPATELYVLLTVGARLGAPITVAIIVITGVLGARLARREGFALLRRVQDELAAGRTPTISLLEGALVVMGGLLLLTPGFLTDGLGFLLMLPNTRQRMATWIAREASKRVHIAGAVRRHDTDPPKRTPWDSPFDDETPS